MKYRVKKDNFLWKKDAILIRKDYGGGIIGYHSIDNLYNMPNADTGVLTNFHPMPKRFMVWDKELGKFRKNGDEEAYYLSELLDLLDTYHVVEIQEDLVIVQSTNLFDKDGKEIFEGSIVYYDEWEGWRGVVAYQDGYFILRDKEGNEAFLKGAPHQKLAGHILSNPELLEEK